MNVIVITGASSGMGREFALQLDRGLKTIDEFWLIARRADRMKELSGHMRHRVKILPLDLTAEGDISLFGEVLQEERPKIRMLVNCAGYGLIGDFSASNSGYIACPPNGLPKRSIPSARTSGGLSVKSWESRWRKSA